MKINWYPQLSSNNKIAQAMKTLMKLKAGEILKGKLLILNKEINFIIRNNWHCEAKLQNNLYELKNWPKLYFRVQSLTNEQILIEIF